VLPGHIESELAIDRLSELIGEILVGVISKIELIGKEPFPCR
jgi:hypothetical protein